MTENSRYFVGTALTIEHKELETRRDHRVSRRKVIYIFF